MLTKKHFEAIASILRENKADKELVLAFALYCSTQNPNFQREKFIEKCGWI